jgi:hypothetical protein
MTSDAEPAFFYLEKHSYGVADRGIRDWCYAYDVVGAVRREFELQRRLMKKHEG